MCVFSNSSRCLDLRLSSWKPENLFAVVEPVAQMPSKTIHALEVVYFFPPHKAAYLILRDHTISSAFVSSSLFSLRKQVLHNCSIHIFASIILAP